MKIVYGMFIVLLLSICSLGQADRVIDWTPYTASPTFLDHSTIRVLEIVEFRVDGKLLKPGQPFSGEGEWLKTFSVKVRNISGKRISSIKLYFGLPEAKYDNGVSGFSLVYGTALSPNIDGVPQSPLDPNQEIELIRNHRRYTLDRDAIIRRTGVTDFHSVIIGATAVEFEDGSVWMSYKLPIASSQTARN
jgi:hypothetical protein